MTGKERKALAKKIVEAVLGVVHIDGTHSFAHTTRIVQVGGLNVYCEVAQKRPYTSVVLTVKPVRRFPLFVEKDIGFTKVCFPDEWNAAYGVELAVRKAAKAVAKKM